MKYQINRHMILQDNNLSKSKKKLKLACESQHFDLQEFLEAEVFQASCAIHFVMLPLSLNLLSQPCTWKKKTAIVIMIPSTTTK